MPASNQAAARKPSVKKAAARKAPARKQAAARSGRKSAPAGRASKSVQWIESPDQHAGRNGQTLQTRNHDVIVRWAQERNARPATVPGTQHGESAGVLRFDFPGYGGQTLQPIGWEEWFRPFDERRLIFVYQETMRDGRQSNFFRLENPEREDA